MPALPVVFRDFDFPHRFARCRSKLAKSSLRWIPFGMPRLNPDLFNAVFFLFERTPNGVEGPVATGVLLGAVGDQDARMIHVYAVSSKHAAPEGASIIRVNTKDGKSREIELGPDEWQFIPGGADVSIVDVTDLFEDGDAVAFIPVNWHGTSKFIKDTSLRPGEEAFMLGLFADHDGGNRNIVAARFGNLSMLATEDAPVEQPNGAILPSHIFDMRSRGGFSGAPVFVYRTPDGDLRNISYGLRRRTSVAPRLREDRLGREPPEIEWHTELDIEDNIFVALLGIHAGQYREPVTVTKVKAESAIADGDIWEIPGGMTIVVPLWEVHKLLSLPTIRAQRDAREARVVASSKRKAEPESAKRHSATATEPVPDNSSHKEDFTRLLGAAVKANKPAS